MRQKRLSRVCDGLRFTAVATSAIADDPTIDRLLASQCTQCHSTNGFDGIHIIGDSQATNQPKSAHMANAHAKVCADAIIRSVAGSSNRDPERIPNVTTNSACYSPITYDEASWLTANFAYDPATGQMGLTHLGEAERWSRENYEEMFAWASNLFTDSFH